MLFLVTAVCLGMTSVMLRCISSLGWIWFCRMYIPTLNHALGRTLGPYPPAFYALNALRSGTIHCQRNTASSPRRVDTVHFGEISPRSFETPWYREQDQGRWAFKFEKRKDHVWRLTGYPSIKIWVPKYPIQSALWSHLRIGRSTGAPERAPWPPSTHGTAESI